MQLPTRWRTLYLPWITGNLVILLSLVISPPGGTVPLTTSEPVQDTSPAASAVTVTVRATDLRDEAKLIPAVFLGAPADQRLPSGQERLESYFRQRSLYPIERLRRGGAGLIIMDARLDYQGILRDITPVKGPERGIKDARDILRNMNRNPGLWAPATLRGEPVDSRIRVEVKYEGCWSLGLPRCP